MKPAVLKNYIIVLLTAVLYVSCEDTNLLVLTDAGMDAVTAVTLSDEDVMAFASQAVEESDSKHILAPPGSEYSARLNKLVAEHTLQGGYVFNCKVYLTDEVNAFAMADGNIRVYSGLMDLMSDSELLFVIGHEMGHVVKQHSRKRVVLAYASSALRKGLASQENEVGQIARSTIGAFAQQLTNAQFSQHEERQADSFGASFLVGLGYGVEPAVGALQKLDALAVQHTILSSHPDPAKRSTRLADGAWKENDDTDSSFFVKMWNIFVEIIQKIITKIQSWLV